MAVPILFLAAAPGADAAPSDHVSPRSEQVIAPMLRICLLPIGPIPPIICIRIGIGSPGTGNPPPPPPPPPTSPPPPPTTPTKPPTSPPPTTHSAPPPPPPVTPGPTSVVLRAAVPLPPTITTTTPTTLPPTTPTVAPTPTQAGGAEVLPTSPGTLKEASVSPEVVTERRWALTVIVLIFGGGAVATARMRRRVK